MGTLSPENYNVGWICALPLELTAAIAMLDERHPSLQCSPGDDNSYVLGRVGDHNVAISSLPVGEVGTNSAAHVARDMLRTFRAINIRLLVGVGGGVPSSKHDIRLGDIVVSKPSKGHGGVFQYDFGKNKASGFEKTGSLNAPPRKLLSAVTTLIGRHGHQGHSKIPDYLSPAKNLDLPKEIAYPAQEVDELFEPTYAHVGNNMRCLNCDRRRLVPLNPRASTDPVIHYGNIASGNQVMQNVFIRDQLAAEHGILCFEMEAAGLMNDFGCLVIRGICDYADSHKNQVWQPYAAASAAAYAKELLSHIPTERAKPAPQASGSALSPSTDSVRSPTDTTRRTTLSRVSQSAQTIQRTITGAQNDTPNPGISVPSVFTVMLDKGLNWNEVELGRLVLNLDDPILDYYPPVPELDPKNVSVRIFQDLGTLLQQKGSLIDWVKKLFSNEKNLREIAFTDSNTQKAVSVKLLNSGAVFENMFKVEATKRWIEKVHRISYIYLVVSIHAIVNLSEVGDIASLGRTYESVLATRGLRPGDRIIGVQYRRLRCQKFSSTKVDAAYLERSGRWTQYNRLGNRDDDEDSLDVYLDDDVPLSELKREYDFDVYKSKESGESYILMVCYVNFRPS